MYFLNENEKLYLHKSLIPESREMYIDYELRGWNWHKAPLEPVYDIKLGVADVANSYCPTDRDLYVRKVFNEYFKANKKMVEGSILHKTIEKFVTNTKKVLYNQSVDSLNDSSIFNINKNIVNDIISSNRNSNICDKDKLKEKIKRVWNFEKKRVEYRIQEVLAAQPYIGIDALLYQVIPVVVEQKLDGSFLGLSPYLSTDAINFSEPMIVDTKFGKKRDFHKLSVTGYALVMESLYSFPVNIGCITYPTIKKDRILIDRELFIISDELRQKFIEKRDDKMRMIYEEIDPGISDDCYKICPFYDFCH